MSFWGWLTSEDIDEMNDHIDELEDRYHVLLDELDSGDMSNRDEFEEISEELYGLD